MSHPFSLRVAFMMLCLLVITLPAFAQTPASPEGSPAKTLLVVGDSLSAEYGLARGTGWVQLLEQRLAKESLPYDVINASVSGETTSGGASRLPALLKRHQPAIVILELGANDALRGMPLPMIKTNLSNMTRQAQEAGARVMLVGMQIPPNYGRTYAEGFQALFADVATEHDAALVPFLLEGIATDTAQFQPDRIHPAESAQPVLLENVWTVLEDMFELEDKVVAAK